MLDVERGLGDAQGELALVADLERDKQTLAAQGGEPYRGGAPIATCDSNPRSVDIGARGLKQTDVSRPSHVDRRGIASTVAAIGIVRSGLLLYDLDAAPR